MTTNQKLDELLKDIYKELPGRYFIERKKYPNNDYSEIKTLVDELENRGYIEQFPMSAGITITMTADGKIYVEEDILGN